MLILQGWVQKFYKKTPPQSLATAFFLLAQPTTLCCFAAGLLFTAALDYFRKDLYFKVLRFKICHVAAHRQLLVTNTKLRLVVILEYGGK